MHCRWMRRGARLSFSRIAARRLQGRRLEGASQFHHLRSSRTAHLRHLSMSVAFVCEAMK